MSFNHHIAVIELKERLPRLDYNIAQIFDEETAKVYLQRIGILYGKARKKYEELKEQREGGRD